MKVIVGSPVWSLNGVNVFSANLVRGLHDKGVAAELLLTYPGMRDDKPMPLPGDIPISRLAVNRNDGWKRRWWALIQYLEQRAPCVYLPNYDFWYSGISPKLSREVIIIGIAHSDDPEHYEHVQRLGPYWNGIVAVSRHIYDQIETFFPELAGRLTAIPYGVECPQEYVGKKSPESGPLRIVYHGILKQAQKRIMDLSKIAAELSRRNLNYELTIIGGGPEKEVLEAALRPHIDRGCVRFTGIMAHAQIGKALIDQDVFLMTSEFEGLPNALLEAMAYGCVPVATDIRSGIHEVIENGEEGFIVPVGRTDAFADRLMLLAEDPIKREKMAMKAYERVKGEFSLEAMTYAYLHLFEKAVEETNRGDFKRMEGKILPPPFFTWKDYLPPTIRAAASQIRRSIPNRGF